MFMRAILCCILVVLTATAEAGEVDVQVYSQPAQDAWWLRLAFTLTHNQIRGIPLKEIDKHWQRASELKKEYLPNELLHETGTDLMDQSGIAFSLTGDFNHDGSTEEALVGVYETDSGKRGSFLLILGRSTSGSWRKVFLETIPGSAGFSGVSWNQRELLWFHCMMCDTHRYLTWNKQKKAYVWIPVKYGPD